MTQKSVEIAGIEIPYIEMDGVEYYPLNTILRIFFNSGINGREIKQDSKILIPINYNLLVDNYINETWCLTKSDISKHLESKIYRRWKDKVDISLVNKLYKFFNAKIIGRDDIRWDDFDIGEFEYDDRTLVLINEFYSKEDNLDILLSYCKHCDKMLPKHADFFSKHSAMKDGIAISKCKVCYGGLYGDSNTERKRQVIRYGEVENLDIIEYYEKYNDIDLKIYCNIEDIIRLLKYKHSDIKNIDFYKFTSSVGISKEWLNKRGYKYLDILKVYGYDENYLKTNLFLFPYHRLNGDITLEQSFELFNNYLRYKNLDITKEHDFNYMEIIKTLQLHPIILRKFNMHCIEWLVKCCDGRFIPRTRTEIIGYYTNEENRIFAMQEYAKSLNIEIAKLPLYITKYSLTKNNKSLSTTLKTYYNNDLYTWMDKCFPNCFNPMDFNSSYTRREFDSQEEQLLDDYLRNIYGDNLIYNSRSGSTGISLNRKQPDWFLFTEFGCYIVEYAGFYIPRQIENSKRIKDYIIRFDKKRKYYKELCDKSLYNIVIFYPWDLIQMNGVDEKIKRIGVERYIDKEG